MKNKMENRKIKPAHLPTQPASASTQAAFDVFQMRESLNLGLAQEEGHKLPEAETVIFKRDKLIEILWTIRQTIADHFSGQIEHLLVLLETVQKEVLEALVEQGYPLVVLGGQFISIAKPN